MKTSSIGLFAFVFTLLTFNASADEMLREFYRKEITFTATYTNVSSGTKTLEAVKGSIVYSDDGALCELELDMVDSNNVPLVFSCKLEGKNWGGAHFVMNEESFMTFARNLNVAGNLVNPRKDKKVVITVERGDSNGSYQFHTENVRESYHLIVASSKAVKI
jgi:hypothetical protein